MSDNFAFTPGSGASGASDNIGGIHYPRVKVTWGVDGAVVDASATNPLPVVSPPAATGTPTNVPAATTSTTILAANGARKGAYVENDSPTASLDILMAAGTASPTNRTQRIGPGEGFGVSNYTGIISGIWTVASGTARVTEFT